MPRRAQRAQRDRGPGHRDRARATRARQVAEGLAQFTGTRRRFDFKGEVAGIRVIDDYAHHPTEIAATLRAARQVVGDGHLVVAFQAHHYYRTAMFVKEFGEALGLADQVVVLEVYAPGEEPIPGRERAVHGPARAAARRVRWSSSRPGRRWPGTLPTGRAPATS